MSESSDEQTLGDEMKLRSIGRIHRTDGEQVEIEVCDKYRDGLEGIEAGQHIQVLWWMDRLEEPDRRTLKVHPRGEESRPLRGVFALRSPMRPNPVGVSVVRVVEVDGTRLTVTGFDALDSSPVIDVKCCPPEMSETE